MGSRRKTGDSARLPAVSRRTLLGAVAAPSLCDAVRTPRSNETVAHCAKWLATDFEIDRLSLRWAALETRMAREFGWLALPEAERRALPQAAEMFVIERRLDELSDERERQLETLATLRAGDLHGVASKLAVAARLLQPEAEPAYRLVADAVRELAHLRCPGCGAPCVPPDATGHP